MATTSKPADKPADKDPTVATPAAADAAIAKDPGDLTEAEALSFVQAFGRVPAGWQYDPRVGISKIG